MDGEQYVIDGGAHVPERPSLLWAAPGSVEVDSVEAAWIDGGLPALRRVSGPWAVAAWDPATGEHLLICDPVGTLPLFWARTTPGRIVTGSWLARLVDRHDVEDALDYESILLDQGGSYLRSPCVAHRTPFTGVSRVPGGHALRIRPDGSVRLTTYWDPASLPGPDTSMSLPDCVELLGERVQAAVRRVAPTGLAVGSHVSGGLDCTTVACVAHHALRERGGLRAGYSWSPSAAVVPRFPGDERTLLEDVQREQGFPVRTTGREDEGDWFWQLDPARYPDANHVRECLVLSRARADGVQVLLSGWGGDELASFNGRGVMQALVRRGRFPAAWREYSRLRSVTAPTPPPLTRRVRSFAHLAIAAAPTVQARLPRRPNPRPDEVGEVAELLRPHSALAADLHASNAEAFARIPDHHQWQLRLLRHGHLQRRIGWWYQTGRLMGVEYRYPLLDLGVVEAALRLPWWAYLSQGWTRTAFRLAAQQWVPTSVAWNVQKYEPALYWAPNVPPESRPQLDRRRHRPDDPEFEHTMQLAVLSRDLAGPRPGGDARVTSRHEMAPQL